MKIKWGVPLAIVALLGIGWAVHPKFMCGSQKKGQAANRVSGKLSDKNTIATQDEKENQASILSCPNSG